VETDKHRHGKETNANLGRTATEVKGGDVNSPEGNKGNEGKQFDVPDALFPSRHSVPGFLSGKQVLTGL
jgi:hypothetical protein